MKIVFAAPSSPQALFEYRILSGTLGSTSTPCAAHAGSADRRRCLAALAAAGCRCPARHHGPLGIFKMPFGSEVMLEGDTQRHFAERSTIVRALFPGVRSWGACRALCRVRYAVALMNGNRWATAAFPTRDPNDSKDVLGRVGIDLCAQPAQQARRRGLGAVLALALIPVEARPKTAWWCRTAITTACSTPARPPSSAAAQPFRERTSAARHSVAICASS